MEEHTFKYEGITTIWDNDGQANTFSAKPATVEDNEPPF